MALHIPLLTQITETVAGYNETGTLENVEILRVLPWDDGNPPVDPSDDDSWNKVIAFSGDRKNPAANYAIMTAWMENWIRCAELGYNGLFVEQIPGFFLEIGAIKRPFYITELDADFLQRSDATIEWASANISISSIKMQKRYMYSGWLADMPSGYAVAWPQYISDDPANPLVTAFRSGSVLSSGACAMMLMGVRIDSEGTVTRHPVAATGPLTVIAGSIRNMDFSAIAAGYLQKRNIYQFFELIAVGGGITAGISTDDDYSADMIDRFATIDIAWEPYSWVAHDINPVVNGKTFEGWIPIGEASWTDTTWGAINFYGGFVGYGGSPTLPARARLMDQWPTSFA